ncbi:DNA topoisomerase [Oceanicola sp. 22II-s10i]|uniref:DNA topoisomerase IB n=1 Tax=Oceanicola sp. 22II-s10i TaxID=1317116 RepID=UPI000B525395|nr:DNA topoisomerase IB [Oceanicola sp. 22II-s10i]OWU85256.1 DNA topoisomerase [Oceanicola sp. 22II-s10i]
MGLVFYPDTRPGISRRRCGRGFSYTAPDGTRIDRGPERQRLEAMAVPPAYDKVWMSPRENGHLMATGFDARLRKQYRYHPDWSAQRSAAKYDRLAEFGATLPRIREALKRDLREPPGDMDFAHAAALMLIDRLAIRVGTEAYAEENGTYGATTLRRRHLRVKDGVLHLSYTAKGGRRQRQVIRSRRLQKALQKARDLPGAELFTWVAEDGTVRSVGSGSLNAYLARIGGDAGFTAKSFRTWAGTLAAFEAHLDDPEGTIAAMTGAASDRLANTQAVCRTSYIHPDVIDLAGSGERFRLARPRRGLSRTESALLRFLE